MKSIRIKNFKCFVDKEIILSNLTVLAGGNGAGKSSVIQSFLLFAQSLNSSSSIDLSKKLYLNDYYTELGNSKSLLNYDANSEIIEFQFIDNNKKSINFKYKYDEEIDSNIFELLNRDEIIENLKESNALNFVNYFEFIGADRLGPKTFHHTDKNFTELRVGKIGEYSALIFEKHKIETLPNGKNLRDNVNNILSSIFGFVNIETEFNKKANIAMFGIKNHPLSTEYESPVNMPYGVSYVLPIIISCLVRQIDKNKILENYSSKQEENEIIIIENPEAHLHPSAQSKLGYFLAKMSSYLQIIIETHSEHIINGIRLATLDDDVNNDEISINFFSSDVKSFEPNIQNIRIDKFSDLSDWPKGFFDQQAMDIGKIFQERAKNVKN